MVSHANAPFAAALTAALADLGLTHVCLSPGSRSTPLTLAFAARNDLTSWIHLDERSAGFFALGLARATQRPVALVCTSGTAATEYFPAITEAMQTGVPLIAITADRPPELRDVGAPQTIDQIALYGNKVKWFHHGAPPDAAAVAHAPSLAAHAWGEAVGGVPGPVHLNLPFREPLTTPSHAGETLPHAKEGKPVAPAVRSTAATPSNEEVVTLNNALDGRRALFVVGEAGSAAAEPIAALAASMGAAVFADPQSGLRAGPSASQTVPHSDLLASAGVLDALPPEVVIRWGALPTSKATWRWLEDHPDIPQFLVDRRGRDPLRSSRWITRADPGATAARLNATPPPPSDWTLRWKELGAAAVRIVDDALTAAAFPNEPAIAATVVESAPADGALFAGSSMPIRDIDSFATPRRTPLRIYANRGANGIDGSISTAAGIAASGTQTVALIGDVSALHDVGALGAVARLDLALTIVVVHNDGGGIFGMLPQAEPSVVAPTTFERLFGTPHGTDFVGVAAAFGLEACAVATVDELAERVGDAGSGPRLVQVTTDRSAIAPFRRSLVAALSEVVRRILG